jgi:hypothetical protein
MTTVRRSDDEWAERELGAVQANNGMKAQMREGSGMWQISDKSTSYDAHHSRGFTTSRCRLPGTGCEKCLNTWSKGFSSSLAKFEGSPRSLTRLTRSFAGLIAIRSLGCEEKASSKTFALVCRMKSPSREKDCLDLYHEECSFFAGRHGSSTR